MSKFEDFVRRARLKLSSATLRFFGLCIYPLRIVGVEIPEEIEGYVRTVEDDKRFENRIYINKTVVEKDDYIVSNLVDTLIHEMNHILRRHDVRIGNRDPKIWNIACDHVIDKSLKKLGLSKPYREYNIIKQIENDSRYSSEEDVYNWLINQRDKNSIKIDSKNTSQVTLKNNLTGEEITVDLDLESSSDKNEQKNGGKALSPEQKQTIENYISQIRAIYNIEKERGNVSSNISSEIEDLLEVKVPWDQLLEKAIKKNTFEKTDRRNWKKLNKFYQHLNINLPGRNKYNENQGVGTLIVHIDSSGSINDDDLRRAGFIISKSLAQFEKVVLIIADVLIQQKAEFMKNDQDKLLDFFKREGIKGRGGTSHKIVFDFIEDFYDKNIDELSLIISITDGHSDIVQIQEKYKFLGEIPTIILCNTNLKFNYKKMETININE